MRHVQPARAPKRAAARCQVYSAVRCAQKLQMPSANNPWQGCAAEAGPTCRGLQGVRQCGAELRSRVNQLAAEEEGGRARAAGAARVKARPVGSHQLAGWLLLPMH